MKKKGVWSPRRELCLHKREKKKDKKILKLERSESEL